ncbi:hypothetical protein LTR08_002874 [Meristemomyces frigidus]|nr:hypothetical protein LTR08_002874 [Meristemomyces frigidus]
MFSTKLTRVANRATAASTATAIAAPTPTAAQCLAARATHQRRPSSSKASCPPDDSSKSAPAAKAAPAGEATQAPTAPRKTKRALRLGRLNASLGERMSKSREHVDHFAALPAVPGLQHLTEKDAALSHFFALHRPLSVTTAIPPPASAATFSNIFSAHPARDAWQDGNSAERRPEDVIYTLHNTIDALESSSTHAQDEAVRWEILQESQANDSGVKHLDAAPARLKSLDELVAQFRPFRAPPPPQPFADEAAKTSVSEKKRLAKQLAARPHQHKSYQTTITFTDTTSPDGTRTLTPHVSPLVRITNPLDGEAEAEAEDADHLAPIHEAPRIRQPFLERMRRRQTLYLQAQSAKLEERVSEQSAVMMRWAPSGKRVKMLLISVKRQRKLKMKKHKYKKLMKRTRNLRRRIDRA